MSSHMQSTTLGSNSMPADREALSLMTTLKLNRFQHQKRKFEEEYEKIVRNQTDVTLLPLEKVKQLGDSIERLFAEEGIDRYLRNFDALMAIAEANTSTSNSLLEQFYQDLLKVIVGGKRWSEYNFLFGSIMSQWLSTHESEVAIDDTSATRESQKTHAQLESIIFNRPALDLEQWRVFLETKLFAIFDSEPKLKSAFDEFKSATKKYGKTLLNEKVSSEEVRQAIRSLTSDGGLADHRKRLLIKLSLDDNAVKEFASSLTLMIADLADWRWPMNGVRGIFRRNIAGRYRCFYEEDFVTAIFLAHVGLKWSYFLKRELKKLFVELTREPMKQCSMNSIHYKRLVTQRDDYWMASLPDKNERDSGIAPYTSKNPLNLKTKLFHVVNVEIQLHQTLRPYAPFTVVTADLEWFGPSISHDVVQMLLEHCNMPRVWLDFFGRFLRQPVYYKPGEVPRERQRGVPISHTLSLLLCELVLFGMDLYVYQSTGIFNYRLHDDFWFFHHEPALIETAWRLMNEYARLTGLTFNAEKSGSARIHPSSSSDRISDPPTDGVLPSKKVMWGFLALQPSGSFTIDRVKMAPLLDEMKARLNKAPTIIEWVQVYNQYIAFFMRNFGTCANVLGTAHIQQMIETFQHIHRYISPETDGNILTTLTRRIEQQFSTCVPNQLIEGWFYWPMLQGGLGVKNIFLVLDSYQAWLRSEELTRFKELPKKDTELYAKLVEEHASRRKLRCFDLVRQTTNESERLITFDEYVGMRETQLQHWQRVYQDMLEITPMLAPKETQRYTDEIDRMCDSNDKYKGRRRGQYQGTDKHYIPWLVCYYGSQIESTFNQLDFVDSDNLPIGLITLMKTKKINWDNESKEEQ